MTTKAKRNTIKNKDKMLKLFNAIIVDQDNPPPLSKIIETLSRMACLSTGSDPDAEIEIVRTRRRGNKISSIMYFKIPAWKEQIPYVFDIYDNTFHSGNRLRSK